MDNKSVEGREAHEHINSYQDWYFEQIEAGLADPNRVFVHFKLAADTVYEILVTDQTQADSYIAMAYAVADRIGDPLSATVVDVDYATDTDIL